MNSGDALGRLLATLTALSDHDAARVAGALSSGRLASDADAYGIQAATALTNAACSLLERAFRDAAAVSGSDEGARWLLTGLMTRATGLPDRPQLVWTAPGAGAVARGTVSVIREHIQRATRSVTVVGYSVTSAADPLLRDLAEAARRRVDVAIVADRLEEKLGTVLRGWPAEVAPPALWTRPADPNDDMSALHAKVVIFDDRHLLVSSANLTFHGLHANLELGVLLDGQVAADMSALLREWIAAGLIRRVR